MSMKNTRAVELPDTVLSTLAEHLRTAGSTLSLEQAIVLAIGQWRADDGAPSPVASGKVRGYQWKTLFLPDATHLRMFYLGDVYYAQVAGDHILYQGRQVSPRTLVMCIAGGVRNAWQELYLRFPDSRQWLRARACRTACEQAASQLPKAPAAHMADAARAMCDALQCALALAEQASKKPGTNERRLPKHRRESDLMGEDCSFD